jgi:hypothetical protein
MFEELSASELQAEIGRALGDVIRATGDMAREDAWDAYGALLAEWDQRFRFRKDN